MDCPRFSIEIYCLGSDVVLCNHCLFLTVTVAQRLIKYNNQKIGLPLHTTERWKTCLDCSVVTLIPYRKDGSLKRVTYECGDDANLQVD